MNISTEQLKQIEKLAALFLSPEEIALKLRLDVKKFTKEVKRKNSEVNIAFETGNLDSEIEIRDQIVKMAKLGSPQAQTLTVKYIQHQKMKEKLG